MIPTNSFKPQILIFFLLVVAIFITPDLMAQGRLNFGLSQPQEKSTLPKSKVPFQGAVRKAKATIPGTLKAEKDGELPIYAFDGSMTRDELYSYLSKAATMDRWLQNTWGNFDDCLRMAKNTRMKFAGRVIIYWGGESKLPEELAKMKANAEKIHAQMPDLILEAASLEIISTDLEKISIPEWVFSEFEQPVVKRNFDYHAMINPRGNGLDNWAPNQSVPDIRQLEYQMWVYYMAKNFIDIGCEAMHFGEMERLMTDADAWWSVLTRIRKYGSTNARRHLFLCNAFDGKGRLVQCNKLLWDFLEYPSRIQEQCSTPQDAKFVVGHYDAIYQKTIAGYSPLGWYCERQPYLVEIDNWANSSTPGKCIGYPFIWGYEEISWFDAQPVDFRNKWLQYAWNWFRENDPAGRLQMPCMRYCSNYTDGRCYFANTGIGNQEETIKALWNSIPISSPAQK